MGDELEKAQKFIPAEVRMFSGCKDEQTSSDVFDVSSFKLPDPAGKGGGALTSSLLNVLYADEKKLEEDLSFNEVLVKVREKIEEGDFTQIPQLTSSRPMSMDETFDLVPPECPGTKRALLIGINYIGQDPGELRGCHNDVMNMVNYIKDVHGFEDDNIMLLMDDDEHINPTKDNILKACKRLVKQCEEGDAVFFHYSGHGVSLPDDDGDEADGKDEAIAPVNFGEYSSFADGMIRDDDLFKTLVGSMPGGVQMTCIMDCCHSGTILDLPYKFVAGSEGSEMTLDDEFDFDKLEGFFNVLGSIFDSLFG